MNIYPKKCSIASTAFRGHRLCLDMVPENWRSAEDRVKDMESALNWLGAEGGDQDVLDPDGIFKKLDATLPKSIQSPEERARATDGALNWMRNLGVDISGPEKYVANNAIWDPIEVNRVDTKRISDMEKGIGFRVMTLWLILDKIPTVGISKREEPRRKSKRSEQCNQLVERREEYLV